MSENRVTTIEELKAYAKGQLVKLPSFAEGQPFYAMLKRPSMLQLARDGKIPNSLLTKSNELFVSPTSGFDPDDDNMLKDASEVIDYLAEKCFVEPTFQQIKEAGVELTDEQRMFLFNYTQKGIKALDSFRTEQQD